MNRRVTSKQKTQAPPESVSAQDDAEISSSQQTEPLTTAAPIVARRIRKPKTLPRTESPLFMNQAIEMTATGAPVISATQAYYKRPEWEEYSPGKLYFQRRFGKGRYVEFYIMNRQEQQPEFITGQAEQEVQERYGVMAARLHAVFATYATRQNRPWEEPFCLRGSDLIKFLGLDRRKDMTKPEKLRAIADLSWIVGTLGAVIHWREGELDLCVTRKSPVWIIQYVEEYFQPQLPHMAAEDELCEVIIRVQPGAWAEKFLNREGEQQNKALNQFGYIHQAAFDINPNRQELAAVLTLYLTQNRRARSNGKYRIRTLLEAVIAPSEIEIFRSVRQYRSRLVQRFYDTLETLTEVGFQIQFDESFPIAMRPEWADLPVEDDATIDVVAIAPTKTPLPNGFFDIWLDGLVSIASPSDVESVLTELEARKTQKGKASGRQTAKKLSGAKNSNLAETAPRSSSSPAQRATAASEFTGSTVRQARKELRMSQAELAQQIGKSQSWVRDLENKFSDKPVSLDYAGKLRQILGL
jgi:DNA-binding transcriptional regulator YiaG